MYDNLKDVKIVRSQPAFANPFHAMLGMEPEREPEMWTAVYHKQHKKWLVTDDINECGLRAEPEHLEIIGFADSLDGIMFTIWEHQKSLGMSHTILEEIREKTKVKPSDEEWKWQMEQPHFFVHNVLGNKFKFGD